MELQTQQAQLEQESTEQALEALRWAVEVSTRQPGLLASPPAKPSAAQMRAVPLALVREHLDDLLLGKYAQEGLDAALATGVLDAWLPEVACLVGFGDGEWRHKDVWKHTKQVVWQSVRRLEVRWGALLHDVGKVKTRSFGPKGEVHFFGHAEVGASMFRKRIALRLGFTGELNERLHFLILNHLRASAYDGSWTDAAVRRFSKEMGAGLDDLLALSRADITTKRPERKRRGLYQISELAQRIREVQEADAYVPPLPKGLGNAMMKHFSLPPSKLLGDLRARLEDAVNDGELQGQQDSAYYIAWLSEHRSELGF